mgnify:FL=1
MGHVSEKVDLAIQRLIRDFERVPNKYLTEDDVRMHLCSFLMDDFGMEERTEDDDFSIPLHSEVRWWGPNQRKDRTDIVIFDVSCLSVTRSVVGGLYSFGYIPKKGYASSTPLAAIELKLRRSDGVGNADFRRQIKADIDKLQELKGMLSSNYSQNLVCRVIALDKKEQINSLSIDAPEDYLIYSFCGR